MWQKAPCWDEMGRGEPVVRIGCGVIQRCDHVHDMHLYVISDVGELDAHFRIEGEPFFSWTNPWHCSPCINRPGVIVREGPTPV